MKQYSTIFLKITVILMAIPAILACVFLVPDIADYMVQLYPESSYLKYLVLIGLCVPILPFFFALYQAFSLLCLIDKNKAFSDLAVIALRNIKICAFSISLIFLVDIPLFYLFAQRDDSPGVILLGMGIIFASMVISVFAAVLQKLLKNAIDIKEENDLTI